MHPLVRRTWAMTGRTPILRQRLRSYKNVAAIGALTISPGRRRLGLFFRLHPGETIRQAQALEFLKGLLRHLRGQVVLLWDRLPVHRGGEVRRFIDAHPRLHVEHFPSYAPELNPVEYLWGWLKTNPLANRCAPHLDALTEDVRNASEPVSTNQTLLRSFIAAIRLPIRFP